MLRQGIGHTKAPKRCNAGVIATRSLAEKRKNRRDATGYARVACNNDSECRDVNWHHRAWAGRNDDGLARIQSLFR